MVQAGSLNTVEVKKCPPKSERDKFGRRFADVPDHAKKRVMPSELLFLVSVAKVGPVSHSDQFFCSPRMC
jgi:hypothetical protein